ncbi:hypothetical protein ASA1KI_03540 [Opitutales bacterium ASA1]|uniref:hypothetical protein n=1 Tax=Congregicoccus parvus TaxID=3081749 RepID=UPI002B2FE453|nr:hypothetical protein ASA1KI_03540 [Opitutales bacterium ASA1]
MRALIIGWLTVIAIVAGSSSGVHGAPNVRLLVEARSIGGFDDDESIQVRLYLQNTGSETVSVVTEGLSSSAGNADNETIQVWCDVESRISFSGVPVVVSSSRLGIVRLGPSEIAEIRYGPVIRARKHETRKLYIRYSVPEDFSSRYAVWSGKIEREISLQQSTFSELKGEAKAAEPGATDNPGDAQRLREDH